MTALAKPETASWPRLAALSLAMLLPSLSTSITNVALPELSQSFGEPMPEVQWVPAAQLVGLLGVRRGLAPLPFRAPVAPLAPPQADTRLCATHPPPCLHGEVVAQWRKPALQSVLRHLAPPLRHLFLMRWRRSFEGPFANQNDRPFLAVSVLVLPFDE